MIISGPLDEEGRKERGVEGICLENPWLLYENAILTPLPLGSGTFLCLRALHAALGPIGPWAASLGQRCKNTPFSANTDISNCPVGHVTNAHAQILGCISGSLSVWNYSKIGLSLEPKFGSFDYKK